MKKKSTKIVRTSFISICLSLLFVISSAHSSEIGEPLKILSHEYGFFSGDYYSWSTCRGIGETVEIFVENAVWDSSIVDSSYELPSNSITSLISDGSGGIYIGTANGLAHFTGTSFTDYSESLSKNVIDMSLDGSGTLWIGTESGLYKYSSGISSLYLEKEITAIKTGAGSILWVGTSEGLYRGDTSDSTWTAYPPVDTVNSPVSDVINDIEIDSNGNPWLATDKGISYLDTQGLWQVISSIENLIGDNVFDLSLATNGIWAGTDKGLAFYTNDLTFSNYSRTNSGLTTNTIRKVKLDADGTRWIATGDGLFRFRDTYNWWHFGMDHTNYLEAHTTDTLNSLDLRDIALEGDDVYLATSWGLAKHNSSNGSWETWRGPFTDATVYADSALIAAVLEAWDEQTPGLDTSHYFYNGIASALGINPGGDTLGIFDEVTTLFGDVSDVDENGKVTVFLLDIRDYWDDADGALDGLGDLTFDGFFLEQNLYSVEPTMRKDLLYIDVKRQSQVEVEMALAKTLTRHILYNGDLDEKTWVTQGFGLLSEILTGYVDQSVGFKGFEKLNYPCQNSLLAWQSSNPYLDQQFSELLLLFLAEKHQSGDDGGLGIVLDVAQNTSQQGTDAFTTALSNYGSSETFSDLFFDLSIAATIENWKLSSMPDHPDYSFEYHEIGSVTGYNTIYWGKNNQDDPPYESILPQWSSRIFNGRSSWSDAMEKFRLVKFNGVNANHFRVAFILNDGSKPDTSSIIIELSLDSDAEAIYSLLDTLKANSFFDDGNAKTYHVLYISDLGDGSGVTQMVMSQDVVSPDAFGGIKMGVVQNPLQETLLDLYVTSYEGLCTDVGNDAFVDDGGVVQVSSAEDTAIIAMEKLLEDESTGENIVPYLFTYADTTFYDTLDASSYFMYHAEYTIPADGDYNIVVSGQDVSGNDATSDVVSVTVASIGSEARMIAHSSGNFSINFSEESVQGSHTVVIAPAAESDVSAGLNRSVISADAGFVGREFDSTPLTLAYKVSPGQMLLNNPATVRFSFDVSAVPPEDRPYVGVFRYTDGRWRALPTHINPEGFMEAKTDRLGSFQVQRGSAAVEQSVLPREYALHQNYPNPFNPATTIRYDLPKDGNVSIYLYNVLGQVVSVLLEDSYRPAGYHSLEWNGTNSMGKQVASGLYFYSIRAGSFTATKQMMLVR